MLLVRLGPELHPPGNSPGGTPRGAGSGMGLQIPPEPRVVVRLAWEEVGTGYGGQKGKNKIFLGSLFHGGKEISVYLHITIEVLKKIT